MASRSSNSCWRLRVNSKIRRDPSGNPAARRVAEVFGLTDGQRQKRRSQCRRKRDTVLQPVPEQPQKPCHEETLYDNFELTIRPGQITAVVGPSGAGKSVLLRLAAQRLPKTVHLCHERLARSNMPPVAILKGGTLADRLAILSQCGLAEATVLITPAKFLSGGQLYRLALAEAFWSASRADRPGVVVADEFAASLDTLTAENLCRQVRRMIRRTKISLLLATPRTELLGALEPDQTVVKPLGRPPMLIAGLGSGGLLEGGDPTGWPIELGSIGDYHGLADFHYIAGPPAAHKRVYVIRPPVCSRGSRLLEPPLAAVLVISPPLSCVASRNVATAGRYVNLDRRRSLALLNAEMECISRVIVHPVFRGLGLAVRLVRHALATAHTPWMEALAVMGHVNPFFQRAGMEAYRKADDDGSDYIYYLARTGCAAGQQA